MKKIFLSTAFILLLLSTSFAQSEEQETPTYPTPKWISEKGYWVIETNINTPGKNILYFYDNNNVLVYKEKADGIVINLKKRRVKMCLKKVLEQSITAYNQNYRMAENEMLVVNMIRKN
jgi:hypothetical protein